MVIYRLSEFRKTIRRGRIFLLVLLCVCMCFSGGLSASAGFTKLYVPGTLSFARKKGTVIIYVGDSRTMMLTFPGKWGNSRKNFYLCWVNGGNIKTISDKGQLTPYVKKAIKRYRKRCVVVLNMGVNGNSNPQGNARRIVSIYRKWMKRYPDVQFFVESVNPSIATGGPYSNDNIASLNEILKKKFPDIYIDTYTYLLKTKTIKPDGTGMKDNKEAVDGIDKYHYSWSTGKKIVQYTRKFVKRYRSSHQGSTGE